MHHWAGTLLWYPHFSADIFKAFHWGSNCFCYSHVSSCSSWNFFWKLISWASVADWYFQSLMLHIGSVARNSNIFLFGESQVQIETIINIMHHHSIVAGNENFVFWWGSNSEWIFSQVPCTIVVLKLKTKIFFSFMVERQLNFL